MQKRLLVLRGPSWAAALFLASAVALAAPAKRHQPKAAAAPAAGSAPANHDDAPVDPLPVKPNDDAPAKPDNAPSIETAMPTASSERATAREAGARLALEMPQPADDQARATDDDAALGRREAARIAAGRVQVAVSASADIGRRHFTYSDPVGRLLAPYRLPVAPMASFGLEAYPWASSTVPVLRDLGFRGRLSRAFAVDSKTPDGSAIETSWTRFGGELRERVLLPGSHPFELGLYVGADASYFDMKSRAPVAALLPAARSVSLRVGFDTRLLVAWRLSLLLGGAYLVTPSAGEIYDRFRDSHVAGVDGDFGCVLALTPGLEARLIGRYTRYFASFKPKVGDSAVAGGALDEQLQFGLGVRYAH